MQNKFIIANILIVCFLGAKAQEVKKVAVFDPAGEVESSIRDIVREEISAVVVNCEGYSVLERQLINKVLEENKFQMGGLVDENQISEIGKRMGANYVFVSTVTSLGENYYISCKMIEVLTARIEKQKTASTQQGITDIVKTVQYVVRSMFGETVALPDVQPVQKRPTQQAKTVQQAKSAEKLAGSQDHAPLTEGQLFARGNNILLNGKALKNDEIRYMMMSDPDALRLYSKGRSQCKGGSFFVGLGIGLLSFGSLCLIAGLASEESDESSGAIIAGGVIGGAGLLSSVIGFSMKSSGKNNIRRSVDYYNQNKYTSDVRLDFGVTQNGLGFVLSF